WYNATNDKLLFTSYERDSESGNDYAMARYYSSRLGRFVSPDPLAGSILDPQSLNRYTYVLDDPIHLTDPTGLDHWLDANGKRTNGDYEACLNNGGTWHIGNEPECPGDCAPPSTQNGWPMSSFPDPTPPPILTHFYTVAEYDDIHGGFMGSIKR